MTDAFAARLAEVLRALEQTGTRIVIIGALAAIRWGLVRATSDIDLVVPSDDRSWSAVRVALTGQGLMEGEHVRSDPSDPMPDIALFWKGDAPSTRVDVFLGKTDFEKVVLATSIPMILEGANVHVATGEAVIVYKLLANRPKDSQDVRLVFDAAAQRHATLDWAFLKKWTDWWGIDDRLAPYAQSHGSATGLPG